MSGREPLIFIVGPTAAGKSAVAVEVAEELSTDIISADSRQIYRGMDIGTNKPPKDVRDRIRHHMIDILDPDATFSVGRYTRMVEQILQGRVRAPLIAGGTGLYLRAIAHGLCTGPGAHWPLRHQLIDEEQQGGEGTLYRRLISVDPDAALRIHPRDTVKVIRALEVYELTGYPLSTLQKKHGFKGDSHLFFMVGLRRGRADLYRRIDARVDDMIREGLVEEVERLAAHGYDEQLFSMKGIGYAQILRFLQGLLPYQDALHLIKRETKRYAKRQLTWFNRESRVHWVDLTEKEGTEEAVRKVKRVLSETGIMI